ncbi:MAG TPA: hypothetical protein VKZ83_04245, partial [Phototrophicaceae bacterium]|nr:hypothetical protein [Phototrophicaceae bacterium]
GRGEAEVEALLGVVPEDHSELPDPLELVTRRVRGLLHGVVRGSWTTAVAGALLVLALGGGVVVVLTADEGTPAWARWAAAASSVLVALVAARGWVLLRSDRYAAFQWVRRALTVQLLVTVVALYRIDPWPATAVMAVALLGLGVVQAEKVRLEQTGQGASR